MSIQADIIEEGYIKRWTKNSLLFILNNPLIITLYLLLSIVIGALLFYTPLRNISGTLIFLSITFLSIFLTSIQYEASYKKLTIGVFFSCLKNNFGETLKTITYRKEPFLKFLFILSVIALSDFFITHADYPIVNKTTGVKTFHEDIILAQFSNFAGLIPLFSFAFILNLFNDGELKARNIPFSCIYVLNKFSNFSKETSVTEAIDNLLIDSAKKNYHVYTQMAVLILLSTFIFSILGKITVIFSFFCLIFFPIFFFQAGKEVFLDQGNRKNQKQEEKEKQENVVPEPSSA